ncbi:class III poly(R)-hydroxyalkanoic acid synthase subunit PhaE [Xanthomonas sp. D-109]|uniref:class III poly(R)-hydroxyalkanoic acid synthase subunit PhaE n=1 Tax=Xanthomonas sp. D-109 TaxID=2821274 RepID=UPI001ADC69FB|nr:class III poly(R)-hydroxyalkanoic acid synthase subunit PhaE [Xanthomonas sp. D-109]MBO9881302.1 class III poly(R)-hydroxyalkanoic acid synthase subunit PhaE [Xanthomonas sp. D-109]
MKASGGGDAGDFEAMTRQYWEAWSAALRQGASGPASAGPGDGAGAWREAIAAWSQWLPRGSAPQAEDAVAQFQQQAGDWLGAMQQVAAQFAGRDASSADVADAWKRQVQGQREQLLQWLLGAVRGTGQAGIDPWLQQAAQWLQGLQRDSGPWLQMPGFGPARNHQARWRALAKAQQDYQAQLQAYLGLLQGAIDRAFGLFEEKLRAHEEPGRQLTNARAMFDLWIDAAEEAYAAAALSPEFRQVYADVANAQMRLRALLQRETEQVCEQVGLPTRTELDAAHRRIADLERRLRRLERSEGQGAPAPAAAPAAPQKRVRKTAAKPAAARKAATAAPTSKSKSARAAKAVPAAKPRRAGTTSAAARRSRA